MKLICPKCGSRFSLDQAVDALMQKEVQEIAAKLGEHWQLVFEYTDCFRQTEYGNIIPKTRWRLLKEVAPFIETGVFQIRGKRFRTHKYEIVKAMRKMCNMHKLGMSSHGYLFAILRKNADRLSAEGLTAREEREREQARAVGLSKIEGTQSEDQLQKLPFKDIADNLSKGGKP